MLNARIRLLMSRPGADGRAGEYARLVALWNAADRAHRAKTPRPESEGEATSSSTPAAVYMDEGQSRTTSHVPAAHRT